VERCIACEADVEQRYVVRQDLVIGLRLIAYDRGNCGEPTANIRTNDARFLIA
jgi:hypothetical protein